jgi:uncharacterized protein YbgA (DUF1722 family)/uncharacterized protein YbbK (DUF523 family)
MSFPKPLVYSSKCLGFCPCWWNGTTIFSDFIESIKPFVEFNTHCPEVEIGLGAPRKFLRIVMVEEQKSFVQPATGRDFTNKMTEFIEETVPMLDNVDGFILRENSPSCSIKGVKYYKTTDQKSQIAGAGPGLFGAAIIERYGGVPIESDGRVRNERIREAFLTKLFMVASLKKVRESRNIRDLVNFHSDNKYLLMTFGQKHVSQLGRIVSNKEKDDAEFVIENYSAYLSRAITGTPRRPSISNVLSKVYGYFSRQLTTEEKKYFLGKLDAYRKGRVSLASLRETLRLWNLRYKIDYLSRQTLFEPFPHELTEMYEFSEYKKEETGKR